MGGDGKMIVFRWKTLISNKPYAVEERGMVYEGMRGWGFTIKDDKVSPESVKFLRNEGFTEKMIKEINAKLGGE